MAAEGLKAVVCWCVERNPRRPMTERNCLNSDILILKPAVPVGSEQATIEYAKNPGQKQLEISAARNLSDHASAPRAIDQRSVSLATVCR